MKYVAVGFKVNKSRSIFYIKEDNLLAFLSLLEARIEAKDPDFVSLRMVRTTDAEC